MPLPAFIAAGAKAGITAGLGGLISGLFKKKPKKGTPYQDAVKDAKAAGLHPLFALGAGGLPSPSFNIPGQAPTGNIATEILRQSQNKKEGREPDVDPTGLVQAQTALAAVELARHSISNDTAQTITVPAHQPAGQEVKKGQVDPHMTKNREQSLNVKSPAAQFRLGSQNVWFFAEDMESIQEDPGTNLFLAYNYQGNKNVDWFKLVEEFTGNRIGAAVMRRNPGAFASGAKFRKFLHDVFNKPIARKFTGNPYLGLHHQRTN